MSINPDDLINVDAMGGRTPFERATPGQSLTNDPDTKYAWEQPPIYTDVETAVKNAKSGQVRYRTDKNGIVHGGIGKVGFEAPAVKANLEALLEDLKKGRPAAAKGLYLKKIVLSSTMGPGLLIDQSTLELK